MPYLNLHLDYFDHPKTKRLIGLLGRGSEVLPIRLWAFCGKHRAETGSLAGIAAQEIEDLAGWWGAKGKMIEAMLTCGKPGFGFLQEQNGDLVIHDWKDHAGHLVKYQKRAKIASRKRWGNATSNASRMRQASHKQCLEKSATRIAYILRDFIFSNNPKHKTISEKTLQDWALEVDLMVRRDHRSYEEIEKVLRWSQEDSFWRTNILSMGKFRKQFDQLFLKAGQDYGTKGNIGNCRGGGARRIGSSAEHFADDKKQALESGGLVVEE